MYTKTRVTQGVVGALIVATTLLPVAALARDNEGSDVALPVNISAHLETEGGSDNESGSAVSGSATTTAGSHDGNENETSDNHKQGDEASSTTHRQDKEHQSVTSGHESDEIDGEIEIDQDSADNATTTIDSAEKVSTHGELRSFLNHIVKSDDHISNVHVSSSTIETHYEMPAKFLWAIPMNLTADVSVNSNGSVTVTYPWYAFLFSKHGELAGQLQQSATSTGTTTPSASAQAHLLNLLFANLKGSAN